MQSDGGGGWTGEGWVEGEAKKGVEAEWVVVSVALNLLSVLLVPSLLGLAVSQSLNPHPPPPKAAPACLVVSGPCLAAC
jgi:hypothetical protein